MIRIAATGDVHFDKSSRGRLSQHWHELEDRADLLLIAGDLTKVGAEEEILALCEDLNRCPVPTVAVLGNHDYQLEIEEILATHLMKAKVQVLDNSSIEFSIRGKKVGIFGTKGFGGGFLGACASDFGEKEMKSFIQHTMDISNQLRLGLSEMQCDYKVALLHYAPTPETLHGEKKEIYPFLGSYLLGEAIDAGGAHVAFHGHAHKGTEKGRTPGGVPVRNVAQHVIRHAFNVYSLHELSNEKLQHSNLHLIR